MGDGNRASRGVVERDVVESGPEERAGVRGWLRAVVVLALIVAGLAVVSRSDLLSAAPHPSLPHPDLPTPAPDDDNGGLRAVDLIGPVVVRTGDALVRYGNGRREELAQLPGTLDPESPLVFARGFDGSGPLVGSDGVALFRVGTDRPGALHGLGRALSVIASPNLGTVVVVEPFGGPDNGPRLVEVDAVSGRVVDKAPFPGFDAASDWSPVGILSATGVPALVMSRPAPGGRTELSLAWARERVATKFSPPIEPVGTVAQVLGVAGDRILAVDRAATGCGDASCPLGIVTITRDDVLSRPVLPPKGWVFEHTFAAGDHDGDPLVVVHRADDPSVRALARLVAGGARALLVLRSAGLRPEFGIVGGPAGMVVFARTDDASRDGAPRLAAWLPDDPAGAPLLPEPPLEEGSRVLCVCA